MPGIKRCRNRCAQVDIAETKHEIAGIENDALHILDPLQAVDATDKLDIARTPGSIGPHRLHIFVDGELRLRIIPRERQMNDP